jgi:Bacterial RNA polymerase, alpha chain C terminal domain
MIELDKDVANMAIEDCNLSIRTKNRLESAGILTLDFLMQKSSIDLLRIQGFGKASLKEVRAFLASYGLMLRNDILVSDEAIRAQILSLPQLINDMNISIRKAEEQLRTLRCQFEAFQVECEIRNEANVS